MVPLKVSSDTVLCPLKYIPIFTCGLVRSNTWAKARTPFTSLPKTCVTGLTLGRCRIASRPVLNKGATDLVKVDILFSNEKQQDSRKKTVMSKKIMRM